MRQGFVAAVLRSAVVDALAVSCACVGAGALAACGGAVAGQAPADATADSPPEPDATIDGADDADDTGLVGIADAAGDATVDAPIADAGPDTTTDARADAADASAPADAAPPDPRCLLMVSTPCSSVTVPCLAPGLVVGDNSGSSNGSACAANCGGASFSCDVEALDSGDFTVTCICVSAGRFPAGLVAPAGSPGHDPLGTFLADGAALEASSVRAFEQLARELAAHGAPEDLVARARRAARQEVTHARVLRRAAEARGCAVRRHRAHRAPRRARSLEALARENAVEGCGRETVGAAVLCYQSERAADPALRDAYAQIAADEVAHAELAWDLQAWLLPQLDAAAQARVADARRAFVADCARRPARLREEVAKAVGWPSRAAWRALVHAVT